MTIARQNDFRCQTIDHSCQDNNRLEAQKHHRSRNTPEIITQNLHHLFFVNMCFKHQLLKKLCNIE